MVKGISKRVIVVKTPVSNLFDQAIFILNEGALSGASVDAENILREACAVADEYVRTHCGSRRCHTKKKVLLLSSLAIGILTLCGILLLLLI